MKTKKILAVLGAALKGANFENASFVDDSIENEKIKQVSKVYRETYIIPNINEAIRMLIEGQPKKPVM